MELESLPTQTCWDMWLKHRDRLCLYLEDRRDVSPRIEFLDLLASAGHSHIVKVRIDGKIFALKLYTLLKTHWTPSLFERNALEMDSFIVECQVYDFLIENHLAVGPRCYGWLTIDKEQEQELNRKINRNLKWCRREDTINDPVRGLLLEYIDGCCLDKAQITTAEAQDLRDQLKDLHILDIAHGDLFPRNIMVSKHGGAFLIDFSSAMLWPCRYYRRNKEGFKRYQQSEKQSLELFLFRLQQLKRHRGLRFTDAQSEEEAYGSPITQWENTNYAFVD